MAGAVQAPPQETTPPQPSATDPQFIPAEQLVIGVHAGLPHIFAVPAPPQSWPLGQVLPQSRMPPHPSAILPQLPLWQVVMGMHFPPSGPTTPLPQTLAVPPPPQVCGKVQGWQFAVTPLQSSGCGPQRLG
jgi:hypothetical protein